MRKTLFIVIFVLFVITPFYPVLAYNPVYRFTGQEQDTESGLYNFDAREYNPNIGRFNQPDSVLNNLTDPQKLKEQTGQDLENLLKDPQNLDSYSYGRNNPIKYVDPEGEFAIPAVMILGAVFSGIFFNDIKTAYAPTYNSTVPIVETRNFGDLVPIWRNIPKTFRFFSGMLLGTLINKGSLADDFISIFHGTSNVAIKGIARKGFKVSEGGAAFFTNIRNSAEWFARETELDGFVGKILHLQLPIKTIEMLKNQGLVDITDMLNGEKYYAFTQGAINKLIKQAKRGENGIKMFIEDLIKK